MMSDNLKGALFMALSMTGFTVNDAYMKTLAGELPFYQAIAMRGGAVIVVLALIALALGQWPRGLPAQEWRLIIIRAIAECVAAALFISALFNMPIANVTAILQALPLTVTLAGALFLGEAVGWRRLAAILVGFFGVMLIIQPGSSVFSVYALYTLAAVLVVTLRDLIVRKMAKTTPPVAVALITAVIVTLAFAAFTATQGWVPVESAVLAPLAKATVAVVAGYICSVSAMRQGEIAFVTPFRYTSLLVALVLGWWFFGTLPNGLALIGAAIVVGTGLFTFYREQRLRSHRT